MVIGFVMLEERKRVRGSETQYNPVLCIGADGRRNVYANR